MLVLQVPAPPPELIIPGGAGPCKTNIFETRAAKQEGREREEKQGKAKEKQGKAKEKQRKSKEKEEETEWRRRRRRREGASLAIGRAPGAQPKVPGMVRAGDLLFQGAPAISAWRLGLLFPRALGHQGVSTTHLTHPTFTSISADARHVKIGPPWGGFTWGVGAIMSGGK